jgi:hypothetical protein
MKKLLISIFIFLVLVLSGGSSVAQQNKLIEEDYLLSKVNKSLPAGWEIFSPLNGVIIIQRIEPVYVLDENRINAPKSVETKEDLEKRIKKYGKQVKSIFEFKYYDKLAEENIESAKKLNDSINNIVISLPKKYKIESLRDNFVSSKGEVKFNGNTDDEIERIKKYEIEKYNLLDRISKLPDYNSEKYSLYLDISLGMDDEMHLVWPFEASSEMFKVKEILDKNLIKIN